MELKKYIKKYTKNMFTKTQKMNSVIDEISKKDWCNLIKIWNNTSCQLRWNVINNYLKSKIIQCRIETIIFLLQRINDKNESMLKRKKAKKFKLIN